MVFLDTHILTMMLFYAILLHNIHMNSGCYWKR